MKQLSKAEIQQVNKQIEELYSIKDFFLKKERVAKKNFEKYEILVKDKTPLFFFDDSKPIPTLKLEMKKEMLPRVTVDMGAVKFVSSGADVMRPGIVEIPEQIKEGDAVVIDEETHHKPLAIAKAIYSSMKMKEMGKGKVLKNLHCVGDKLWNY